MAYGGLLCRRHFWRGSAASCLLPPFPFVSFSTRVLLAPLLLWLQDVKQGSTILVADGSISLEVLSTDPEKGTVRVKCLNSAVLG